MGLLLSAIRLGAGAEIAAIGVRGTIAKTAKVNRVEILSDLGSDTIFPSQDTYQD
jgi:hypothetical protein